MLSRGTAMVQGLVLKQRHKMISLRLNKRTWPDIQMSRHMSMLPIFCKESTSGCDVLIGLHL